MIRGQVEQLVFCVPAAGQDGVHVDVVLTSARPNRAQTLLATASSGCSTGPTARRTGSLFRQSTPTSTFALSVADLISRRAQDALRSSPSTWTPSRTQAAITTSTASVMSDSAL